MACGLAGLHSIGIPHGNLHPVSAFSSISFRGHSGIPADTSREM